MSTMNLTNYMKREGTVLKYVYRLIVVSAIMFLLSQT